jgi:hypothetical protein
MGVGLAFAILIFVYLITKWSTRRQIAKMKQEYLESCRRQNDDSAELEELIFDLDVQETHNVVYHGTVQ